MGKLVVICMAFFPVGRLEGKVEEDSKLLYRGSWVNLFQCVAKRCGRRHPRRCGNV